MVVAASLSGAATDRFYISDFSISTGQTRQVSIMLDNEVAYTAFQADIHLTGGLEIIQDNGSFPIALTNRKGSDHVLAVVEGEDGTIRIMSYSIGLKTFSGNSGPLVTLEVTAGADFVAPAFIILSNIRFTTLLGEEVEFNDSFCIVGSLLRGDVNDDGDVNITDVTLLIDYLLDNSTTINPGNADLNGDSLIMIDDVTILIDLLLSA